MFFNRNKSVSFLSMEEAKRELSQDKSICLIDVRSSDEYASGHIPGSMHLPLDRMAEAGRFVPDKDGRIFIYCLSGARSYQACVLLAKLGYSDVTNIGGITQWTGKTEKAVGA